MAAHRDAADEPRRERNAPRPLLALSPEELAARVEALGGRPFHARILRANVLAKGELDYARMTSLPAALRAALAAELPILSGREVDRREAADGTIKLLVEFPPRDRAASPAGTGASDEAGARATPGALSAVELVHMPSLYAAEEGDLQRGATLCVSTQIGCPVACPFCASGQLGLLRNLAAHEILEQYVRGRALGALGRSVVMGMGEPLLNYENLSQALSAVHDEMGLGSRKVTVSTVGFPERLRKIARDRPRFQLAISLHTPDQEQRDALVPAMKGVPIEEVLAAGDDWFEATGREVTYEYILLGGENDDPARARRLVSRLRGRRCTVNLIPFNPVRESAYRRPRASEVEAFRSVLASGGIVATVRWSRGVESDAACGQLRLRRGAS